MLRKLQTQIWNRRHRVKTSGLKTVCELYVRRATRELKVTKEWSRVTCPKCVSKRRTRMAKTFVRRRRPVDISRVEFFAPMPL